jgi:hypothetical protein
MNLRRMLSLRIALALSILSLAAGCAEEADPATYGTRRVAVSTACPETHRAWAVEAVARLDALGREAWVVVAPESAQVTVRCRVFPSCDVDPARCDAGGSYQLGDLFVEVNPEALRDSASTHHAVMHELIHQRVAVGLFPERATVHVCRLVNELPGAACYAGWHGEAVMNPAAIVDGSGGAWDGIGRQTLDIIYPGDVAFYRWATGR